MRRYVTRDEQHEINIEDTMEFFGVTRQEAVDALALVSVDEEQKRNRFTSWYRGWMRAELAKHLSNNELPF